MLELLLENIRLTPNYKISYEPICASNFYINLDGRCSPLPTLTKASPDTVKTTNGTVVTVSCDQGHVFPDKSPDHVVQCDGVQWNISYTECTGQSPSLV